MESINNDEVDLNISTEQINRLGQVLKKREQSSKQRSLQKRPSFKMKNINKQVYIFNKDQISLMQTLANYLQNVDKNIELIDDFCQKRRIHFLCELKNKVTIEEYKSFLNNAQVYKIGEGGKLQQQGKFHNYHYILIEGRIGAFRQKKIKDQEKQYLQAFQFQIGEVLLSNTLQNHKYNPYTVRAKKNSLLFKFTEETYIKSIKRVHQKEIDQLATSLCHTLPFRSISANQMKKYIPYFSFKRFTYNQIVYCEGDLIRQLFLILNGEAEIGYQTEQTHQKDNKRFIKSITPNLYKINHQANQKKQIKIVRVGKRQLFGLQAYDVFNENYYQHHVRVVSDALKVLCISLDVLYDIQMENPTLQDNLLSYVKKVTTMHNNLFEKYQKIKIDAPLKKKKKRRKNKRKSSEISLQWWGLAQKIQGSKRYRLPTPPHSQSQKALTRKQPLQLQNRTSKIDYFKRRLFEDQMQGLEQLQQKENDEHNYPQVLIPKLQKVKIKMINPKPKVINNAEKIKKKLVEYAKNGEIYCDQLQLQ